MWHILILKLYGNNKRCTVYNYSEKKHMYFGTYNLTYMYLLFDYFYNIINKKHNESEIYSILLSKIAIIRNTYLENHNITVIERTGIFSRLILLNKRRIT